MDPRYRVFRRGGRFYKRDTVTGQRTTLKTTSREEAAQIVEAENRALADPILGQQLAKAYLSASDPRAFDRTWSDAMVELEKVGCESTRERKRRVFKSSDFDPIRVKPLLMTSAEDFFRVLDTDKVTTKTYLIQLQNLALDLGWLPKPIVPRRRFPKIASGKKRRAITAEEHRLIIEAERNEEQRLFYEFLWHTGAAQSDAAALTREHVDPDRNILMFTRAKTGQICRMHIADDLRGVLDRLPAEGILFPRLSQGDWRYRSAEFARRCRLLGIRGVSLHSYRYSWAERAFAAGIAERHAMAALGHGSKAVHRAYAKAAEAVCPPLPQSGLGVRSL